MRVSLLLLRDLAWLALLLITILLAFLLLAATRPHGEKAQPRQ
jgi:hypothetical protein